MSNSKKHNSTADSFSDRSAQFWPATLVYPRLELIRPALTLCQGVNFPDGEWAPTDKATAQEIRAAAGLVFLAVQAELEIRGEGFQPRYHSERSALYALWQVQRQAEKAGAVDPENKTAPRVGRAKQLQLEASMGKPLAVCIGRRWRNRPPSSDTSTSPGSIVFLSRGDGCGVIFSDSTSKTRFHSYCPGCRQRKFDRELEGRLRAGVWGRQSVPLPDGSRYFIGKCFCGEVFKTFDVRQSRCQKHHKNRRSLPAGYVRTSAG